MILQLKRYYGNIVFSKSWVSRYGFGSYRQKSTGTSVVYDEDNYPSIYIGQVQNSKSFTLYWDISSSDSFSHSTSKYDWYGLIIIGGMVKMQLYVTRNFTYKYGRYYITFGGGTWHFSGNRNMDFAYKSFDSYFQVGISGGIHFFKVKKN